MEQEIVKVAISQGLGYALFVFLLIYVLKTTQDRENRLNQTIEKNQSIIQNLTENNNKISKVEKDVEEIKIILKK
ncbi:MULTISPECIES: BhlA/UviB family holin-like peptide [unclassified Clostridium]|uniref:BhlA/UviB family holin-like peptide n=1 Tax=unclassified Clostridium TaxID=2614128 RepID=UPI0025B83C93|nr:MULTISPECIES: BhlA/UviB family holin-like peptide [unclassified Clostridium]